MGSQTTDLRRKTPSVVDVCLMNHSSSKQMALFTQTGSLSSILPTIFAYNVESAGLSNGKTARDQLTCLPSDWNSLRVCRLPGLSNSRILLNSLERHSSFNEIVMAFGSTSNPMNVIVGPQTCFLCSCGIPTHPTASRASFDWRGSSTGKDDNTGHVLRDQKNSCCQYKFLD